MRFCLTKGYKVQGHLIQRTYRTRDKECQENLSAAKDLAMGNKCHCTGYIFNAQVTGKCTVTTYLWNEENDRKFIPSPFVYSKQLKAVLLESFAARP